MAHLPIWPAPGAAGGAARRADALARGREEPRIMAHLDVAIAAIRGADRIDDANVARGYAALDDYLAELSAHAELELRCSAGCSTCCADAPPVFAVEAVRIAAALRAAADDSAMARASDAALRLADLDSTERANDPTDTAYRVRQLEWRATGTACPLLVGDRCSQYDKRPLACRVYASIEDPAHCDPGHPRFTDAERPPRWSTPREFELEAALLDLGERCGLGRDVAPLAIAVSRAGAEAP